MEGQHGGEAQTASKKRQEDLTEAPAGLPLRHRTLLQLCGACSCPCDTRSRAVEVSVTWRWGDKRVTLFTEVSRKEVSRGGRAGGRVCMCECVAEDGEVSGLDLRFALVLEAAMCNAKLSRCAKRRRWRPS